MAQVMKYSSELSYVFIALGIGVVLFLAYRGLKKKNASQAD